METKWLDRAQLIKSYGGRMVGQEEVRPIVALFNDQTFVGTGVLLHVNWVMAAAHQLPVGSTLTAYSSIRHLQDINGLTPSSTSVSHFVPPGSTSATLPYTLDVCLLKLEFPLQSAPTAAVVTGPYAGSVDLVGWGEGAEPLGPMLSLDNAPQVSAADCAAALNIPVSGFQSHHLCYGGNGHGPCSGDSGGGLFFPGANSLVGIHSGGEKNTCTGKPGIGTRLAELRQWIDGTTSGVVSWV